MKLVELTNRARRALSGGSPGVTLIEALVAIVLVSMISAAFMWALAVAAQSAAIADIRTNAESLARSQLEYVKSQDYDPAPWEYEVTSARPICGEGSPSWCGDAPGLPDGYEGYRVEVRAGPLLEDPGDPESKRPGIQTVTVRVFHVEIFRHRLYGDDPVITLSGYKRKPPEP